jgi:patatin-related protein
VVLYGGVSLAIYMHGSMKELHRLVSASAAFEAGRDAGSPLGEVYRRALKARLEQEGVPTRIVVDIISGTSAGGINGVYLAKALARGESQDALRDLWLREGDIDRLLRAPRWLPRRLRIVLAAARAPRRSLLLGDRMSAELMTALEAMDDAPAGESLVPASQMLELFVTATDFEGSPRQVMLDDPDQVAVADRAHRAVLRFRYRAGPGDTDEFTRAHNPLLAFAARATSCFPGAFPPVRFADFAPLVGAPEASPGTLLPEFGRAFELAGVDAAAAWFIDGGVLDNRPFGHAIRAIRDRRADSEVDRRLLYLEPDPPSDDWRPKGRRPGQVGTVVGALSGIPRHEPILDDLMQVARLNERAWSIRRVIETNFDVVAERVARLPGLDLDEPDAITAEQLLAWQQALVAGTGGDDPGRATYVRLRISAAVDRYAIATREIARFPEDSSHAQLVMAVFRHWIGDQLGLLPEKHSGAAGGVAAAGGQAARDAFLRDYDLDYTERLLRFLIAGVNWYYRDLPKDQVPTPTRPQLDRAKGLLYARLNELNAITGAERVPPAVRDAVAAAFPDEAVRDFLRTTGLKGEAFSRRFRARITRLDAALREHVRNAYGAIVDSLHGTVVTATDGWPAEVRRRYLVRYLGFPLWDVILFPIQHLGDVNERDRVEVQRWSPRGRRMLKPPLPGPKLVGTTVHHFGAFLDAGGRQRDYLWGRLDACERLIQLLVEPHDADQDAPSDGYEPWFAQAALAILDEEEAHLPGAAELIRELRKVLT